MSSIGKVIVPRAQKMVRFIFFFESNQIPRKRRRCVIQLSLHSSLTSHRFCTVGDTLIVSIYKLYIIPDSWFAFLAHRLFDAFFTFFLHFQVEKKNFIIFLKKILINFHPFPNVGPKKTNQESLFLTCPFSNEIFETIFLSKIGVFFLQNYPEDAIWSSRFCRSLITVLSFAAVQSHWTLANIDFPYFREFWLTVP